MKIGLIRCMQTEDLCPASTDLAVIAAKQGAFADIQEDITLVAINSCGGCPGKKAVTRAQEMVRRGADTICFASCITRGNPIGYPCPFATKMQRAIAENLDPNIRYISYTH